MQKYIGPEGKERAATQAIKEYFGSPGYPPVELKELKALMPSCGGPGSVELGMLAAKELGWASKPA